jgi:hypothetical protein
MGKHLMDAGRFTIYQWNGKDLFLAKPDGGFSFLSRQEIPQSVIEKIQIGRQIAISNAGKITMVPSLEELLERLDDVVYSLTEMRKELAALRKEKQPSYVLKLEPVVAASETKPQPRIQVDLVTYRRRRKQLLDAMEAIKSSREKDQIPGALELLQEEFQDYEKEL